ncbi:unnamed protein product [Adineta steineri]|uniref:C-type lectin domain-containing protein n=1 Tax=Adineta steineri TaxID=433720 RepID=A0A819K475_9BILA|nr:unnamed protein product [Adineta steineri]
MLRSHFEFACVLYIIFILSVLSVSFNDFCSNDLSCHYPLICSNLSKCICPSSSSSFWNTRQNSCLSCPSGWIEWQHEKCLLFIVPSENDFTYEKARNSCLTYSSELLHIDNDEDLIKFQYKIDELLRDKQDDIVWKFLSDGVWMNRKQTNLSKWCNMKYESDVFLSNDCIRITKTSSNQSALIRNNAKHHKRFIDIVSGFIGNIFLPAAPTVPATYAPQIIYHTNAPQQLLPQTSKSNNTIIYIAIGVAVIILISVVLCCCCFGGGFFLWQNDKASKTPTRPSRFRRQRDRVSVDSTASDATS